MHNTHVYITHMQQHRNAGWQQGQGVGSAGSDRTANLCTKILDFRGYDSSRILIQRSGILMSVGNFPESLSQQTLVGRILAGR